MGNGAENENAVLLGGSTAWEGKRAMGGITENWELKTEN
jgi:hypothetical protein